MPKSNFSTPLFFIFIILFLSFFAACKDLQIEPPIIIFPETLTSSCWYSIEYGPIDQICFLTATECIFTTGKYHTTYLFKNDSVKINNIPMINTPAYLKGKISKGIDGHIFMKLKIYSNITNEELDINEIRLFLLLYD